MVPFARESDALRPLDVAELRAMLHAGAPVHLLDVRETWEHATAALPGSQLIPLGQLMDRAWEIEPPDGALLVVYCHHGIRSMKAAMALEAMGFRDVANLTGGIDAWSREVDPAVPRY